MKRDKGEKKERGIPILKYGKGNNIFAFQQALARKGA
jgi:hypothetical protein